MPRNTKKNPQNQRRQIWSLRTCIANEEEEEKLGDRCNTAQWVRSNSNCLSTRAFIIDQIKTLNNNAAESSREAEKTFFRVRGYFAENSVVLNEKRKKMCAKKKKSVNSRKSLSWKIKSLGILFLKPMTDKTEMKIVRRHCRTLLSVDKGKNQICTSLTLNPWQAVHIRWERSRIPASWSQHSRRRRTHHPYRAPSHGGRRDSG